MLDVAREHGLNTHLDGARLMNAVVASGIEAAAWADGFDSAWLDFTKGLGAPVGACLAGSAAFIEEAWRWKQMLGGAMRQSGIVAAAGLYALDHHVERLADDHARARRLAQGLAELPGVTIDPATVETNIVTFDVPDAPAFTAALAQREVSVGTSARRACARSRTWTSTTRASTARSRPPLKPSCSGRRGCQRVVIASKARPSAVGTSRRRPRLRLARFCFCLEATVGGGTSL